MAKRTVVRSTSRSVINSIRADIEYHPQFEEERAAKVQVTALDICDVGGKLRPYVELSHSGAKTATYAIHHSVNCTAPYYIVDREGLGGFDPWMIIDDYVEDRAMQKMQAQFPNVLETYIRAVEAGPPITLKKLDVISRLIRARVGSYPLDVVLLATLQRSAKYANGDYGATGDAYEDVVQILSLDPSSRKKVKLLDELVEDVALKKRREERKAKEKARGAAKPKAKATKKPAPKPVAAPVAKKSQGAGLLSLISGLFMPRKGKK